MSANGQDIKERLPRETDNAIQTLEYLIRRKRNTLNNASQKTELSENEKIKIGTELDFIVNVERLIRAFKKTFHAQLGKVPPCDISTEEAILGALLLDTRDGVDSKLGKGTGPAPINAVKDILKPEHFYRDEHQRIYRAILHQMSQGEPMDMVAIKNRLRKTGELEVIGGAYRLAELTANVSSAASIEYWAREVIEYAMKREIIMVCADVLHFCYEDGSDPHEGHGKLKEADKKIDSWIK